MTQTLPKMLERYQRRHGLVGKAALARAIGVSIPTIYQTMAGQRIPNKRTIGLYTKAFHVSPETVLHWARAGHYDR
jgi:transcriptional regulator with XRE-family HTH domain